MVSTSFGCSEHPFRVGFDERLVYPGTAPREALDGLRGGIHARNGVSLVTGPAGIGKTTLLLKLAADLKKGLAERPVHLFPGPVPALDALIATVRGDPGATDGNPPLGSQSAGGPVVLVDEAQSLSDQAFTALLALAMPNHGCHSTLAIVLAGESSLLARLARERLAGRTWTIGARYTLGPLEPTEVSALVRHRLRGAGCTPDLFGDEAIELVAQLSAGIPGTVTSLCRLALLFASEAQEARVTPASIERAASAVLLGEGSEDLIRSVPARSVGDAFEAEPAAEGAGVGGPSITFPDQGPAHSRGASRRRVWRSLAAGIAVAAATLAGSLPFLSGMRSDLGSGQSAAQTEMPSQSLESGPAPEDGEGDRADRESADSAGFRSEPQSESGGATRALPSSRADSAPLGSAPVVLAGLLAPARPDLPSVPARSLLPDRTQKAVSQNGARDVDAVDSPERDRGVVHREPVLAEEGAEPDLDGAADSPLGSVRVDDALGSSPSEIERLLALAEGHLKADRLVAPRFDNALAVYRKVLRADPGNPAAVAGLAAIKAKLMEYARTEAAAGDLDSARRQLNKVRAIDQGAAEGSHKGLARSTTPRP